ncbi:hypothetical protein C1J01_48485, partial [Nonomuraea aridisoli]
MPGTPPGATTPGTPSGAHTTPGAGNVPGAPTGGTGVPGGYPGQFGTPGNRAQDVRPWNEPESGQGQQPGGWTTKPVVPGAPPWEPPPAFTAAAAGMPVWPPPVSDPHALPPWPAATGELVAEPDEPSLPPPFDPNATNPEGLTRSPHGLSPETGRPHT